MKKILLFWFMAVSLSLSAQINSYTLNAPINGVGNLSFDLDSNSQFDFYFDIIELSPGVYAARVTNVGLSSYLDNSTFHYPDALNFNDSVVGYFNTGNAVLGTFTGAGQFSGAGDKYLGIKINDGINNYFGWILLNCNSTNDTLRIISYGYNTTPDEPILAGQTFINSIDDLDDVAFIVYPNPAQSELRLSDEILNKFDSFRLFDISGKCVIQNKLSNLIDCSELPRGMYTLGFYNSNSSYKIKIFIGY